MKVNQNNSQDSEDIYNIDSLILSIPCPETLMKEFGCMPLNVTCDNRDGFTLCCVHKEGGKEKPDLFYLMISYYNGELFGMIRFDRKNEMATLEVNKDVFYENLTICHDKKINMLPLVEYILSNLGFDLAKITIQRLTIVRDSKDNVLKRLSGLNSSPNYDLYLNDTIQEEPIELIEKTYIRDESMINCKFSRLSKQNVFYIFNITGTLEMASYEKSKEIHNVSRCYKIFEYNGYTEDQKFYRTEVTMRDECFLKEFFTTYDEKGFHGFFSLTELFSPDRIKELFNFISPKLIRFQHKESNETLCI